MKEKHDMNQPTQEEKKPAASFVTIVDDVALRSAVRLWMATPLLQPLKGQDLYLKIIAHSVQLPYDEVAENYSKGDTGVQAARRKVKRIIFAYLCTVPASVLRIHDEVVVHADPTVESRA